MKWNARNKEEPNSYRIIYSGILGGFKIQFNSLILKVGAPRFELGTSSSRNRQSVWVHLPVVEA